ncbi:MAG: hypothetical protein WDM91_10455 [Rhizomicrobium sp.]
MKILWEIRFKSDAFLPTLPEDSQVNPGVYGFELAFWLSQRLADAGFSTCYPQEEDWGWFVDSSLNNAEVMVGCRSTCGAGEGFSGQAIGWSIFVKPYRTFAQWFRRESRETEVQRCAAAIMASLADRGIRVGIGSA